MPRHIKKGTAARKKSHAAIRPAASKARKKTRTRRLANEPSPKAPRGRPTAALRALDAVAAMRHGKSMRRATQSAHTTARTVRKYAKPAVRRARKKYRAASFDRIPRTLRFLSPTGIISVTVKDSRRASRIATFFNAVHRFLVTGDVTPLEPFRGESFRVGRTRHRFITDPKALERLADAGQVSFEEIYANTF